MGDRANGTRGALSQWVQERCCRQTSLYTVHTVYISLVIRQQAVAVWCEAVYNIRRQNTLSRCELIRRLKFNRFIQEVVGLRCRKGRENTSQSPSRRCDCDFEPYKKKTDLIRNRKSQVQIQVYLHYMKVLLYLKWLVSAKTVLNDKNR